MVSEEEKNNTLSDRLIHAREKANVTLTKMAELTGVNLRYLKALESGDYQFVPPDVYAIGILRKYAKLFNLNLQELISLFETERGSEKKMSGPSDALPAIDYFFRNKKAIKNSLRAPKVSLSFILGVIIIGALAYFIFSEVSNFILPPAIVLTNPSQDVSVTDPIINITGVVTRTKSLTINQKEVYFDKSGNFSDQFNLTDGINTIELKASNSSASKVTKIERKIIYSAPKD